MMDCSVLEMDMNEKDASGLTNFVIIVIMKNKLYK